MFIFQGTINAVILHRDIGLGDSWECPLPDGYELLLIDTTDIGSIRKGGYGVIDDVRFLQLSGPYILAASDSKYFQHFAAAGNSVDAWSLLDTRNGSRSEFNDLGGLRSFAQKLHIAVNLRPIEDVYSQYRFTWFDAFAGFLLFIPPSIAMGLMIRYILRVRRSAPS